MNINIGVISFNKVLGRDFVYQLLDTKLNIDHLFYISTDDFENPITGYDVPVESIEYSKENVTTKNITIAVLIAPCSNQEDLIKSLVDDGAIVVSPANSVSDSSSYPLVNVAINSDDVVNNGSVILTPTTPTMMLSPIISVAKEQYGLDRIVANVVYCVDDVCNHSHSLNSEGDSILEQQITKEIRKLLKEEKLPISVTTVPTIDKMTYAFINAKLDNDFVIADISMFAKKFDDIIPIDSSVNELPNIENIKEKHKAKMFLSRVREDKSVDYGFNLLMSSVNLPSIELANKVKIVSLLVKNIKNLRK